MEQQQLSWAVVVDLVLTVSGSEISWGKHPYRMSL